MPTRHHEVTRLESFSDAVFAFSLTLLVVSLEVPKTIDALEDLVRGMVPFALMFAMVCWIWYEHNKFFRRYGLQDAWTAALNSLLLFVVLFYVYPLKFLTMSQLGPLFGIKSGVPQGGDGRELMVLYSSGVVMIFGSFVLLYRHARSKRAELGLTPADEVSLVYETRAHALSAALGVASIATALISRTLVPAAGFMYALMGPLHAWNGTMQGRAMRRLAGAHAGAPAPAPPKTPGHAKR